MSPFHFQRSSGPPTYTAASANLSLSGLDTSDFSPLDATTNTSTTALDADWYHHHHHQQHSAYHLPPLSPAHDHYGATAAASDEHADFASHSIAVSGTEIHRTWAN
ncbi:hypothetical protein K504DRAFT_457421, partial [Pleomassaria siparia CBS 279.74]